MDLKKELDLRIQPWALLRHPFYQAWESGTLPVDALQTYAREYGAFIGKLPSGWSLLLDDGTAQEEREHAALWNEFAAGLETNVGDPELPAVTALVTKANKLFSRLETALGALYAFEIQQPETAKSKLDGLRKHYNLPKLTEAYFEVHSANHHEAAKLLSQIAMLHPGDCDSALTACAQMSEALWNALTDIYNKHCQNSN
ncbi:MAG TPA: iron-containing redox enzyme family protein [Anaerolineales bacterium]|jgi:pyrroloquinoline-quinone synthase|nr:iron-containing redox enzyme family protein [Anaerolineales bacterium]